jgi:parallel beta-helix repeat protein
MRSGLSVALTENRRTGSTVLPGFYVSAAGNDANAGSFASPWLTVGHAITATTAGDIIRLRGGDTFAENVASTSGRTLTSYGTGNAIVAPATGAGIKFSNCGGVSISNITVTGSNEAPESTTTDPGTFRPAGIYILNSGGGTTKYDSVSVTGCTVTGFISGVLVYADTGTTSGYSNLTVNSNTVHDCRAFGIFLWSSSGSRVNRFSTVSLNSNTVHHIPGYSYRISGIGMIPGFITNGTVNSNTVYSTGYSASNTGGGPGGIVSAYCDTVVHAHNEVYLISRGTTVVDGYGIDIDVDCVDCIVEGNYTHDNEDGGLAMAGFGLGRLRTIFRNNLSVNDGRLFGSAVHFLDGVDTQFINNTVIQQHRSVAARCYNASSVTGTTLVANNIFADYTGLTSLPLLESTASGTLKFEGNSYYRAGASATLKVGSTTYTGIAAIRGAGY